MSIFNTPPPLSFRCSPSDAVALAEAAALAGCSRSELIREGALALAALVKMTKKH